MDNARPRLHPLLMIAAIAVTLFSLVGIGVMTDLIPGRAEPAPAAETLAAPAAPPPVAAQAEPPATTMPPPPPAKARPAAAPVRKAAPAPIARREAPRDEPSMPPPPAQVAASTPPAPAAPPVCRDCGTIQDIRPVTIQGEGSGAGAAVGGLLGGVLGHQVGSGRGNDAATVLGAIGGAVAGHQIEKSQRKTVRYDITVRMDDGELRTVSSNTQPAWRDGDRVRLVNGTLGAL